MSAARSFSRREEAIIDNMIQGVICDLSLGKRHEDELRSIGWHAFLSVYDAGPERFRWAGEDGWTQAYLQIRSELAAYKAEQNRKYHTVSLDQPISSDSETPLRNLLPTCHGDFAQHICLRDYVSRLPENERWLARTLERGYTLEEIPSAFRRSPKKLERTYHRLRASMEHYLEL